MTAWTINLAGGVLLMPSRDYPFPELRDRDYIPFLQKGKKLFSTEPVFVNLSRSPGIDSQPGGIDS
jgi:hypothetical protein